MIMINLVLNKLLLLLLSRSAGSGGGVAVTSPFSYEVVSDA